MENTQVILEKINGLTDKFDMFYKDVKTDLGLIKKEVGYCKKEINETKTRVTVLEIEKKNKAGWMGYLIGLIAVMAAIFSAIMVAVA